MSAENKTPSTELPINKVVAAKKQAEKLVKKVKTAKKVAKAKKNGEASHYSEIYAPLDKVSDDKKIKILVEANPKREGSRAADAFDVYKNGMTVAKALEVGKKAGLTMNDIRWDVAHGFIKLA